MNLFHKNIFSFEERYCNQLESLNVPGHRGFFQALSEHAHFGEPRLVGLHPFPGHYPGDSLETYKASPVTELSSGDNVSGNTWFQSTTSLADRM